MDWNSWLTTRRGKLLRDYADKNSSPIFGQVNPTTNSYNPSATSNVLDMAVAKDLAFPVYLTLFSALISDRLPVHIDTVCRSFFHHPPDRPNFRRTDWVNFQTHLEDHIPFDLELHNGKAIDIFVDNFYGAVLQYLTASTPKPRTRDDTRPPIPAGIKDDNS